MAMSLHCWAQLLSLGITSNQNHNFSNSCSCFFCCCSWSIQKPFPPRSSLSHSLSAAFDGKFQIFLNSPECMCFMSIRNCFTFGAGWFSWPTNSATVSAFSDHASFFGGWPFGWFGAGGGWGGWASFPNHLFSLTSCFNRASSSYWQVHCNPTLQSSNRLFLKDPE